MRKEGEEEAWLSPMQTPSEVCVTLQPDVTNTEGWSRLAGNRNLEEMLIWL